MLLFQQRERGALERAAASTIQETRASKSRPNEGVIAVETRAFNQHDQRVLSYRRNLLVYKRSAETPYAAAGY